MSPVTLDAPLLLTLEADRLKVLEADTNLRHTSARWLAHEAVYPGMGALDMALCTRRQTRDLLIQVDDALAEFIEKLPYDKATGYLRWLQEELQNALDEMEERDDG